MGKEKYSAEKRFAVALSFPGEYRKFVERVAELLANRFSKDRILYDKYHEAEFARPDLDIYLPALYKDQSELIVIFLCPEYRVKRWCKLEWRFIRQLISSADQGRIMLLSFGEPGNMTDLGILPGDGHLNISGRNPDETAELIIQRFTQPAFAPSGPSPDQPHSGNLRQPNPFFVGRKEELAKIEVALLSGRVEIILVVHGFGGMGKTELVVEFADRNMDRFPAGIWFVKAEGHRELLPLLGGLASELGIGAGEGMGETAESRGRLVLKELKRRAETSPGIGEGGSCLLVLENMTEPELLSEPQLACVPPAGWLRIVVTTRIGFESGLKIGKYAVSAIPVDALPVRDAADLIERRQPGGKWPAATANPDKAAALKIAEDLDGFALAVEAVAVYLFLYPDVRPSAYRKRLRQEGLTSLDSLGSAPDVAAQMRHREKQIGIIVDLSLEPLAPVVRSAIGFAALLPPESIPWPWLKACLFLEQPDSLRSQEGYPDPWMVIRRCLIAGRWLTPGSVPEVTRMHRLIGGYVFGKMDRNDAIEKSRILREAVEGFANLLESAWEHTPTALWELEPLEKYLLLERGRAVDDGSRLGRISCLVGGIELVVGLFELAGEFLELAHDLLEKVYQANPQSAQAARDVSVSLERLADFLASRGQEGDADKALGYYERGLAER
ncbi:MAG: hypothetical protein JW793_02375, partial [Acidobacteria bacterium]|nr:hypothetical protein [Acidobacteriota bacterium]